MRSATAIIRSACIVLTRVLILVLLCIAVTKCLGGGLDFAAPYVATAIAIDSQMRVALLKEEFDGRDE